MSTKLVASVLKLKPGWRALPRSAVFYQTPVGHMLCGFVHEKVPDGAYLWHYALPLYEPVEFFHLTWGERFAGESSFLSAGDGRSVDEEAAEFVRRAAAYEAATYALNDVSAFLARVESQLNLDDAMIERTYAMTLAMSRRYDEALQSLERLGRRDDLEEYDDAFRGPINSLRTALKRGPADTDAQLKKWEAQSRRTLGVES